MAVDIWGEGVVYEAYRLCFAFPPSYLLRRTSLELLRRFIRSTFSVQPSFVLSFSVSSFSVQPSFVLIQICSSSSTLKFQASDSFSDFNLQICSQIRSPKIRQPSASIFKIQEKGWLLLPKFSEQDVKDPSSADNPESPGKTATEHHNKPALDPGKPQSPMKSFTFSETLVTIESLLAFLDKEVPSTSEEAD
ncbi:hypothetical protein QL285_089969 [Trifolium repens]|nr:hypothetical protein QL285_089969 [Trifolium repens]